MGDRVSVQFEDHMSKSVVLFHHWGGTQFPKFVLDWFKRFMKQAAIEGHHERWQPHNILMPCIAEVALHYRGVKPGSVVMREGKFESTPLDSISSSIYLGKDEFDGDNTNHGNFLIHMNTMIMRNEDGDVVYADDHVEEYV